MFRWLRNRLNLYTINRQERKLVALGRPFQREAQEKNDPSIFEKWEEAYWRDFESIRWARSRLVSNSLLEEADRLQLPRPQYSDKAKWQEPDEYGFQEEGLVLTAEAMAELRGVIRKERRERRESLEFTLKIVGAFVTITTGLVGALIGLISVLRHK
jgi:hypothetical protein